MDQLLHSMKVLCSTYMYTTVKYPISVNVEESCAWLHNLETASQSMSKLHTSYSKEYKAADCNQLRDTFDRDHWTVRFLEGSNFYQCPFKVLSTWTRFGVKSLPAVASEMKKLCACMTSEMENLQSFLHFVTGWRLQIKPRLCGRGLRVDFTMVCQIDFVDMDIELFGYI